MSELEDFLRGRKQNEPAARRDGAAARESLPPTEAFRPQSGAKPRQADSKLDPSVAHRRSIEVGDVFAGDYRIFGKRAGGMGRVYLAEWLPAEREGIECRVALKTVADFQEWQTTRSARGRTADEANYRDVLIRFEREAEAWVRLQPHDYVLFAARVIEVGAKPYLVMQYADGGDLDTWIRQRRLTPAWAVNFAIQFCRGMSHVVATAGMVHRDIKPANVLIKGDHVVKIADFGLSKSFDLLAEDCRAAAATPAGDALSEVGAGTLPYMAPEQFQSLSRADTRSDVFSFGAMFFEMLTSRRLFEAKTAREQFLSRARSAGDAHEIDPRIPPVLSGLIRRCVAFDPDDRYQSFDEILADLLPVYEAMPEREPIPTDPVEFPAGPKYVQETFSLIALGRHEKAARLAEQGLARFPEMVDLWINKSKACGELGDRDGAVESLRRALSLEPRHARAWANLAALRLANGQPQAAFEAASLATKYDPNLTPAWMIRGESEIQRERPAEAVRCCERAIALEPHNWLAQLTLGEAYSKCRRYAEAVNVLRSALEINPRSPAVWVNLAAALSELGDISQAQGAIDRALVIDPNDGGAWAIRGLIFWRGRQDEDLARVCLEKARKLDSRHPATETLAGEIADGFVAASRFSASNEPASTSDASMETGDANQFSRCRYWMCSCGAVFEKESLQQKLLALRSGESATILGSRTCANCRRTFACRDIYTGKYDVPRQHWQQLERQHGKTAEV